MRAWNIIFGEVRLMAIIDLTQGCTPNHCYFIKRNHSFREKCSMIIWKIIISASTSIFVIRKIKLRRVFKPVYLCIFSYGDTIFLGRDKGREKKLLWFVNDVWLQRVTFGIITSHEISISVELRTKEFDRQGNIVDSCRGRYKNILNCFFASDKESCYSRLEF